MARTTDPAAHSARRNEILDSVQRLLLTTGYQHLTVQDVLDDLDISKGAFYHYFDSKPAAIAGLTERLVDDSEQLLATIVADPCGTAPEKLRRFFTSTVDWKSERRRLFVAMLPVWYGPENAAFQQQLDAEVARRLTPALTVLVEQGCAAGTFTVSQPRYAAEIVLTLIRSLQASMARRLLDAASAADITAAHASHLEAIERCLGIPANWLPRVDTATAQTWIDAANKPGVRHE